MYCNYRITYNGIKNLSILTNLNLNKNTLITNDNIKNLTNLTSLSLVENEIITDDGIKDLTNLISLNLGWNNKITDNGVKNLTNLISLNLTHNNKITGNCIKQLSHLTNIIYGDDSYLNNPYFPILMDESAKYIENNKPEFTSDLDHGSVHGVMFHGLNIMNNIFDRIETEYKCNNESIEQHLITFLELKK